METLQIQPKDNLSIDNLSALQEQGFSVIRSAHVGNLSPYNLTLADAGIPMLLVDHNVTGVDKNYFPELQLTRTGEVRIADDGTVTNRTIARNGQFLDEFHIAGITEAIPNVAIITNTEYLRQNESVAGEIIALAVKYFPENFTRIVQSDGTTQKVDSAVDMIPSLGIMQLNDDPRAGQPAVLIPNILDITINFVIEALRSERDVQYHVSGPDMISYALESKNLTAFQELYEIVKREASFGDRLPRQLIVHLIPATSARFTTSALFQPELEGLFTQIDAATIALAGLAAKRKAFFESDAKKNDQTKQDFIATMNQQQFGYDRAIIHQAEQVPGLFAAPKNEKGFVTQYDVIKDGGLYVASQNMELTFNELKSLAKRLVEMRKKQAP